MLVHVTEALYEDDPENPFDGEAGTDLTHIGFAAAAITQLCTELGVPIHIKWGGCEIESHTPDTRNTSRWPCTSGETIATAWGTLV